jgi:hypothetical protein
LEKEKEEDELKTVKMLMKATRSEEDRADGNHYNAGPTMIKRTLELSV